MVMLQALHSKSAAKARQGAHFWASMIEQEEEEKEGKEEKEGGIEFATTYLAHMPALVEGLVASLVCLAEAGDLPGRPADCLILLCRCPFSSVRSSLRTQIDVPRRPYLLEFSTAFSLQALPHHFLFVSTTFYFRHCPTSAPHSLLNLLPSLLSSEDWHLRSAGVISLGCLAHCPNFALESATRLVPLYVQDTPLVHGLLFLTHQVGFS